VFKILKDYIAAPDAGFDVDHAQLGAERDRAVSAANER
jgi:hypothetical protein